MAEGDFRLIMYLSNEQQFTIKTPTVSDFAYYVFICNFIYTQHILLLLQVCSWSFDCVLILLIYFQIAGKYLLQGNKYVSVKSTYVKALDKLFCEGFPNSAAHTS